jgi:hypothetical protein
MYDLVRSDLSQLGRKLDGGCIYVLFYLVQVSGISSFLYPLYETGSLFPFC